jgi:hypothetical protein
MSRAVYTFTNKESNQLVDVIEFELLDNVGCRAWQYAVMLNSKSRIILKKVTATLNTKIPTDINDQYAHLRFIIDQLSTTEFKTDLYVPESFDLVAQGFMNALHRHFTNSCAKLWNLQYTNFDQQNNLNAILQELNISIHKLEDFIPTKHKLKYYQNNNNEIWTINNGRELGYDIFPFRQYHSYEPTDLILNPYILGKTLLESFFCDDDPTSWDTRGHMRTNGGACMILSTERQEIYESKEFVEWLNDYNLSKEQCYADFPLGNFVPGHKDKLISLQRDLHKYSCQVDIQL